MTVFVNNLDELLGAEELRTGEFDGDERPAPAIEPAGLLGLWLQTPDGNIVGQHQWDEEIPISQWEAARRLTANRLREHPAFIAPLSDSGTQVIGWRQVMRGHLYYLGCLVEGDLGPDAAASRETAVDSGGQSLPAMVSGLLAAAIFAQQEEVLKLHTRIDHLSMELAALKASHAEAVSAAVEEREERIREQERHFQQIETVLRKAADGIITVDEDGRVRLVNEAAERIFGYTPEELVGRNVACLEPPERVGNEKGLLAHVLHPDGDHGESSDAAEGSASEVKAVRKDGTRLTLEMAASEVEIGAQRVFTVIFRDITQRRFLEAQLRHAQKLESIGQLAAGIAHEINTPTQFLGDNIRFLQEAFGDLSEVLELCQQLCGGGGPELSASDILQRLRQTAEEADIGYLRDEIPAALEQSLEGVNRVGKIVRSMKEFSHPGSDQKQTVDFNRAIENTITVSRNEWKYVAEMVTDLDPHLPSVACLPAEMNQVLLNLVVNAAQAIGEKLGESPTTKGTITVTTRSLGDWIEIRVSDTGTGMPQEVIDKIFDPFFTTKPVGKGTGQGLAIARNIVVNKHGGRIDVESAPGKGTTFVLRLPAKTSGDSSSHQP